MKQTSDLTRADSEADDLAEQIRYHNEKYWVEHKPEISDIEYDQIVERLRALQPDHPALLELVEDETRDTAAFPKVKHDVPMLSIEKVFAVEDVIAWGTDGGAFSGSSSDDGIVAEYKIDGCSCSLIYESGKLLRAASRGNGMLGDDITRNARVIAGIPHEIPALADNGRIEVRGEIYMSLANFKKALAHFEKQLAAGEVDEEDRPTNPRNYAAGSIKQKDARITATRGLSFMAHGCFGKLPNSTNKSEAANAHALKALGFDTAFFRLIDKPEDVALAIAEIEAERKQLPYEIDGVVFTVNRLALHQELGYTSHHPRFRLAYKFSRDRGETRIVRILWHTTRSGRVAPAMEVAPVSLGGATVALCTLHNAKTVKATQLRPGDTVLLEREVIPYFVQRVSEPQGDAELPTHCHSCNAELVWDETETNLTCPNLGGCPSQLLDYLAYYTSRGVVNIMGVGEKLISKLIQKDLLKTPADFFTLTEQQILDKVERQGETSARKAVAAIQSHREQTLETFLVSLGIRGLGPSIAARLAAHFGTLEALLRANSEDLMHVEGIAETLAAGVQKGLADRKQLIEDLLKHVTLKEVAKAEGPLSGKSFCLTGHVEFDYAGTHYDARPEIEALIKSKGGTIKSVSKTLTYLVAGSDAGSKLEKAKKAGIQILDAEALIKLLS